MKEENFVKLDEYFIILFKMLRNVLKKCFDTTLL